MLRAIHLNSNTQLATSQQNLKILFLWYFRASPMQEQEASSTWYRRLKPYWSPQNLPLLWIQEVEDKRMLFLNKLPFHIPRWDRTDCSDLKMERAWWTDRSTGVDWESENSNLCSNSTPVFFWDFEPLSPLLPMGCPSSHWEPNLAPLFSDCLSLCLVFWRMNGWLWGSYRYFPLQLLHHQLFKLWGGEGMLQVLPLSFPLIF